MNTEQEGADFKVSSNTREVKDFPAYSVDENGVIYREGRSDPVAQTATKKGYLTVNLSMNGRAERRMVHRVVLEAFVGVRPNGFHGCHKDGNKRNNAISNLEWASPAENEAHKALHGTKSTGERNGWCKLSEEQVRLIRERKATGAKRWGATALSKEFGVDISTVIRAASGRHWGHIGSKHE